MADSDVAAEAAKLSDELRRQAEAAESEARSRSANKTGKKSNREQRSEDRARLAEAARKLSFGSIYRQLAKVLHPDLESEPDLRSRKSALMQDVTTAYRNQDLHTLLRLQLEWIQREEHDIARLTEERLAAYNLVLEEQVAQLQMELAQLPRHPKYEVLMDGEYPFGVRVQRNGPAKAQQIDEVAAGLRNAIALVQAPEALKNVRVLIQEHRAATKARARSLRAFRF